MYTLLCMCVYLVIQSCPTLCDPVDCAPGSFIHGILQVRILEWVAITFSRESTQPRDRTLVSCTASKFFTVRATREANNTHKGGSVIKKKKICLTMQEMWVWSLGQENPLEEEMATHSNILAGKSHGQKGLAGYNTCGHKESDTTEHKVHIHYILKCLITCKLKMLGFTVCIKYLYRCI